MNASPTRMTCMILEKTNAMENERAALTAA